MADFHAADFEKATNCFVTVLPSRCPVTPCRHPSLRCRVARLPEIGGDRIDPERRANGDLAGEPHLRRLGDEQVAAHEVARRMAHFTGRLIGQRLLQDLVEGLSHNGLVEVAVHFRQAFLDLRAREPAPLLVDSLDDSLQPILVLRAQFLQLGVGLSFRI